MYLKASETVKHNRLKSLKISMPDVVIAILGGIYECGCVHNCLHFLSL